MSAITIAAPPIPADRGFLRRQLPVFLILGSFFVLTVPLAALTLLHPEFVSRFYVIPIYVWTLGTTHFVITLTIYLQSANLRYFSSTWKNRALYFLVPAGIFVLFDFYTAFQVAVTLPLLDSVFHRGIRFLDFHHVTRQSFGVTLLLQGRERNPYPSYMKQLLSAYFWSLTIVLLLTFWSGGTFDTDEPLLLVALGVVGVLFLAVLFCFFQAWRRSTKRSGLIAPATYLILQTFSSLLGVYMTELWMFGLAMHYAEYHVLMVPRCFNTPLDESSKLDQFYGRLRSRRLLFYAVLFAVAGGITYLTWSAMGPMLIRAGGSSGSTPYLLAISLFDGLFVFHYFIESLIWKFGDPFYRSTLRPLYFGR